MLSLSFKPAGLCLFLPLDSCRVDWVQQGREHGCKPDICADEVEKKESRREILEAVTAESTASTKLKNIVNKVDPAAFSSLSKRVLTEIWKVQENMAIFWLSYHVHIKTSVRDHELSDERDL